MEIKKKTWLKYFQQVKSGKKKFDIRLADFEIKEGDILVLEEYEPETKQYTGRTIRKKVTFATKINITDMYKIDDIKKFGLYGIGFE